jgi:prevent-host-death family protein
MTETATTASTPTEAETERLGDAPNRVTSAELVRNFSELADKALTEPLIITKNGRDRLVLIAVEDYHRLKRRERIVRLLEDTPEEYIRLLEQAVLNVPEDDSNELIKDWHP